MDKLERSASKVSLVTPALQVLEDYLVCRERPDRQVAGASGDKGSAGPLGAPGQPGFQGSVGQPGDVGFTGDTGPYGSQGPQGNPGQQGKFICHYSGLRTTRVKMILYLEGRSFFGDRFSAFFQRSGSPIFYPADTDSPGFS